MLSGRKETHPINIFTLTPEFLWVQCLGLTKLNRQCRIKGTELHRPVRDFQGGRVQRTLTLSLNEFYLTLLQFVVLICWVKGITFFFF